MLIGVAGAVGALLRVGLTHAATRFWEHDFPYGTLLVNVIGCGLIGFFYHEATGLSQESRMILGSGFLGALTTFSAFGHDTVERLGDGRLGWALLNVSANLALGLAAVALGFIIAQQFGRSG